MMVNTMTRFIIILSLSSLASGQLNVPPWGCSVCGDGKQVTAPSAVFSFPGQPEARCDLLESAGLAGVIPADQCSFLPPYINEVCQCTESPSPPTLPPPTLPPTSPPTSVSPALVIETIAPTSPKTLGPVNIPLFIIPTTSPTSQPVTPTPVSLNECPVISEDGCSACGNGYVVSNFEAIFSSPGQPDEGCLDLQLKGLNGVLSESFCSTLPALIFDVCGCVQCGLTPPPTPPPTRSPTPSPTTPPPSPAPTTSSPTPLPTAKPTSLPTPDPTHAPTPLPTPNPSPAPTTSPPTPLPTPNPSPAPTTSPPTPLPTAKPTSLPTPDPTLAPTPSPTTPPPTPAPTLAPTVRQIPCPDISTGGCSVCGDGLCVGNRDATFTFPGQDDILCGALEDDGILGSIDPIQCQVLPAFATEQCECGTTRPAPVVPTPPSAPPTDARITIAPTAQDFGCSICGNGFEVANPDAIFVFPDSEDNRYPCSVVQDAGYDGLIRNGQCERLPPFIEASACGCQPLATSAPVVPDPTAAPVTPSPLTPAPVVTEQPYVDLCPAVPSGGCSVCGGIECVNNPNAIWSYPDQPDISCGDLEVQGLNGVLNPAYCAFLPGFISEICQCGPREGTLSPTTTPTNPPTSPPTASTTSNPTPVAPPTAAPVTPAPNAVGSLDIPDTLIDAGFFTTMIKALNATGLIKTLSEQNDVTNTYTIFAPSNDALASIEINLDCMFRNENLGALNEILEFHVVPGIIASTNFFDGQSFTTLNGDTVNIAVDETGEVKVENALVNLNLMPGVNASNGIVYLVEDALVPSGDTVAASISNCEMLDLNSSLVAATYFTEFLEALDAIDVDLKEPNGLYTVFALGTDTIETLPYFPVECLSRDEFSAALEQMLGYHIVPGRIMPYDFYNGQVLKTLAGEKVTVSIVAGEIKLNGATINQVSGGVEASNGIFYVVDDLIIPPGNTEVEETVAICSLPDIPSILKEATFFKTLILALEATGLGVTLSEPNGPFTIFAPADDSFDTLPEGLLECLLKDDNLPVLAEILQYHVVAGRYLTSDLFLTGGMTIDTLLNGTSVDITASNSNVLVNDIMVEAITSDYVTSNGIIQLIETGVLIPPSFNLDEFLSGSNCVEQQDTRLDNDDDTGTIIVVIIGASAGIVLIAAIALLIHRRR